MLQAHFFERAAEQLEKDNKFDEAVLCHKKAVELLERTLKISTFPITQESLQLQIEYHQSHEKVLRYF